MTTPTWSQHRRVNSFYKNATHSPDTTFGVTIDQTRILPSQVAIMTPSLEHVFTMRMYTSPDKALVIPEAKGNSHRIIAFLTHGHIKGSGLEAELLPGGADWILRDPDTNTGHLDVRVQFRSKEGHGIYIHFKGVLQIDEKWMEVFTGGPKARTLEFGENEWLGSPIIETSHPELKWVERSAFVSELRWFIDEDGSIAVENAVYKVKPSRV
ncbi:hypothetical protein FOCG_15097 [Fusarium oxysporum f. sp. radicis-lycopersici 26381]|nr:hypothetical protein FOCG_15097 [Fusarium oxysporum f. sp. radicis-lycopersici 26381]